MNRCSKACSAAQGSAAVRAVVLRTFDEGSPAWVVAANDEDLLALFQKS